MGTIQTFDYGVTIDTALLWQYEPAVRLQALIEQKQNWYSVAHSQFWSDWYRDVFDLRTANDFGLSVWSIILNLPLVANSPNNDRPVFGVDPQLNFHDSNFADLGTGIALTTEEKRLVLRLRYFQLITDGCPGSINAFLFDLFKDLGQVYVLDGLDMTCEYIFKFYPSSRLLYVFNTFDVLPRPAGVELTISINPGDTFGFDPYYRNFDHSNFGR